MQAASLPCMRSSSAPQMRKLIKIVIGPVFDSVAVQIMQQKCVTVTRVQDFP